MSFITSVLFCIEPVTLSMAVSINSDDRSVSGPGNLRRERRGEERTGLVGELHADRVESRLGDVQAVNLLVGPDDLPREDPGRLDVVALCKLLELGTGLLLGGRDLSEREGVRRGEGGAGPRENDNQLVRDNQSQSKESVGRSVRL